LVFSLPITSNGPNAINVLGDTTYGDPGNSSTQSTFSNPQGLAYDSVNQNLYVADYGNSRVMIFNVPPGFTNGENASYEFGQTAGGTQFTAHGTGVTAVRMNSPDAVAYDPVNSRLFVSDKGNNRVLVFSTASLADGPTATNVIGQTSFTNHTAASSQTGLSSPIGIAYDTNNSRLFVTNLGAEDVLVYNTGPSVLPANTASASFVLGTTSLQVPPPARPSQEWIFASLATAAAQISMSPV
jgi:DNA-binding beta-propeller fold protein YncE